MTGNTSAEQAAVASGLADRLNTERARDAKYAFAVFDGVVREVCEGAQWVPAGSTKYKTRTKLRVPGRWEFTGKVAPDPVRRRYVDRSVASYFTRGAQAPFSYVGCYCARDLVG